MTETADLKHVMVAGGRLALESNGQTRVSIPMAYLTASLTHEQQAVLWRWSDAKQLLIGNMTVVVMDGQPRGRFRDKAARGCTLTAYTSYECNAYRWIMQHSVRNDAEILEIFARQQGEMIEINFIDIGKHIANTDDNLIGFGAAVGRMVGLANLLIKSYAEYGEFISGKQRREQQVATAVRAYAAIAKR